MPTLKLRYVHCCPNALHYFRFALNLSKNQYLFFAVLIQNFDSSASPKNLTSSYSLKISCVACYR